MEEIEQGDAEEVARENARAKARAVARQAAAEGPVVGVDTVVALDDRLLPKPESAARAREWLEALAGRTHRVVGGLCVVQDGAEREAVEVTNVTFRAVTTAEIEWYLASKEWDGKAGGYAIQGRGAALVERVEGDYLNVVGLPLAALLRLVPDLLAT